MGAEQWKQIQGYEGLYQISSSGRVKSLVGWNGKDYYLRDKIISPFKQKCVGGYRLVVKLTKDKKRTDFKVDKLVADAFNEQSHEKVDLNIVQKLIEASNEMKNMTEIDLNNFLIDLNKQNISKNLIINLINFYKLAFSLNH